MLISDSHQFIFVHIRKSAGNSFRDVLTPLSNPIPKDLKSKIKSRMLHLEGNYQKYSLRAHSPILEIKKIMPPALFDNYFKFAFVRHPFTRLASEYEYVKSQTEHGRHNKVSKMSFQQYITYQSQRFDAHQINMLVDENDQVVMDFIGKFESIHDDWLHVCKELQISVPKLNHKNRATKVNKNDYINDENKALVAKLWKRDIDAFGY